MPPYSGLWSITNLLGTVPVHRLRWLGAMWSAKEASELIFVDNLKKLFAAVSDGLQFIAEPLEIPPHPEDAPVLLSTNISCFGNRRFVFPISMDPVGPNLEDLDALPGDSACGRVGDGCAVAGDAAQGPWREPSRTASPFVAVVS